MFRTLRSVNVFAVLFVAGAVLAAPPQTSAAAGLPASTPVQLIHEGHTSVAQASGTVNAVDASHRTVNLSYGSIRTLGWPAMTMDFPTSPDVDLATLEPGMRVNFTLVHGNGGMVVDSIQAATSNGR